MNHNDDLLLRKDPSKLIPKSDKKAPGRSIRKNKAIQDRLWASAGFKDSSNEEALVIIESLEESGIRLPKWRRLSHKNKAAFYHLALKQLSSMSDGSIVVPFTINLTPTVIQSAQIDKKRSFSSYIRDRLTKAISRDLKRKVEMYFIVDIDGLGEKGRPHLHGEMLFAKSEEKIIRQAIHNLFKAEKEFKNRLLRFEWSRCDAGWSLYAGRVSNISAMYFDGKGIAATRNCSQQSRRIYEDMARSPSLPAEQ